MRAVSLPWLCGRAGVGVIPSPLGLSQVCHSMVVAPGADRCSRDQMLKTRGSSCDSCRNLPDEGCLWKGRACLQNENFSFWRDVLVFAGKIWMHWCIPLSERTSIYQHCLILRIAFPDFDLLYCSALKRSSAWCILWKQLLMDCQEIGSGTGLCYEEPTQEMAAKRRLCWRSRSQSAQVLPLLGNTGVGFGCHSS